VRRGMLRGVHRKYSEMWPVWDAQRRGSASMKEALAGPGRANFFALSEKIPFPRRPSLNDRPNHWRGRLNTPADSVDIAEKRAAPREIHWAAS